MILRGKKYNVAKTAIARELACFVWGIMTNHMDLCSWLHKELKLLDRVLIVINKINM